MITTIIISILTCIFLILSVLLKPTIKIKNLTIQSFWIVSLIGAILILITNRLPIKDLFNELTKNSSINPLKILVLFISISFLSITLDELGFFQYISLVAVKKVKNSQYKLFFILYFLVAFLTIFTSNDIVILTITPFICYFSKKAKLNPLPYLICEFINANTYSMLFSIGNPTNIYLSQSFNIDFLAYFKVMFLPTLFAGISSLLILLLLFNKQLKKPIEETSMIIPPLKNKKLVIINLIHLGLTTIFLAISSYINIEMWIISLLFATSLLIFVIIHSIKFEDKLYKYTIKRLPFNLIPFLISMFTIVTALNYQGVLLKIANAFSKVATNEYSTSFLFGISSTLADNLINNIPMTVLYSQIISNGNNTFILHQIYSSIIGSNIGAYLTPIGALAGIMWMSILKVQEIDYSFKDFIKYGILIVPVVLISALFGLIVIL